MKQKTITRAFSLLLVLALVCTLLPQLTLTARAENAYSGDLGYGLTWSFDPNTGTLAFQASGYANMHFSSETDVPWNAYRASIKRLELPAGLQEIGNYAFKDCTALTSVSFPETISSIQYSAFQGCTALTSVSFPQNGVRYIYGNAFEGCTALTSLSFPKTLYRIDGYAFRDCTALSTVTFSAGMNEIRSEAFGGCTKLKSITLPEGLQFLAHNAFDECTSLTSISLPSTLTEIDFYDEEEGYYCGVFLDCPALTTITVASGNPSYSSDANGVLYNSDKTLLIRVPQGRAGAYTVPASVKTIISNAFDGCSNLIQLTLPTGITELPALYHCTGLTSLTIPEGITEIGDYEFKGLRNLKEISLPESLTSIGDQAFYECKGLQSVKLPSKLSYLGYRAFYNCTGLKSVVLPSCTYESGSLAFQGCSSLTSLTIPEGCTQIGNSDFTGCTALESVSFPSTLQRIEYGAFWGCTKLKTVFIPKGVGDIGYYVFRYCLNLTAINVDPDNPYYSSDTSGVLFDKIKTTLICCPAGKAGKYTVPDGVKLIEDHAFAHCWNLTSLTLPNSLSVINDYAIIDCTNLKSIKIPASVQQIKTDAVGKEYGSIDIVNMKDFVVYGYSGTAAQTYAINNKLKFVPLDPETGFSDVTEGAYYHDAVLWAIQNGVTGGTSDVSFSPKKTCTREQIVTFLWKAMGAPEPTATESPFTDVKQGKYYYKPVLWAVENGITGGATATNFGVGKSCTREQAMSFLWKAMGSPEPKSTDNPFTDVKAGKYYYKAVLWAVENGITGGTSAGKFGVGKTCTRAQIVTFLYKAVAGE